MPSLTTTLQQIRNAPLSLISSECALALGAFLSGYKATNGAVVPLIRDLAEEFQGPDAADACIRAYLLFPDSRAALHSILDRLQAALARAGEPEPSPGWHGSRSFVEVVRDAILQARPGMVLGEPSVVWLSDYARGHLAGLEVVDQHAASQQTARLAEFETWIRGDYGAQAPWHGILRVFEGVCEYGLHRFLDSWDAFEQAHPERRGPS